MLKLKERFKLGNIVMTNGARNTLLNESNGDDLAYADLTMVLLTRHVTGDFGDICDDEL